MSLTGFGNHHQTEAIAGALPQRQNSPQQCAFGLYAEQLSGSAFTAPRHLNQSSWLYRTLPSVVHADFIPVTPALNLKTNELQAPNPYRWSPHQLASVPTDFLAGLFPIAGTSVLQAYLYQCNQSMHDRYFINNDAEMLFIPYEGNLVLATEFGRITLLAGMIAVIPKGVIFRVIVESPHACGYVCENAASPLKLPSLGVIGANGLANPRHFIYPDAAFEEEDDVEGLLICKYQCALWSSALAHSPLNVVAWHGNYAPYSYDLSLFNTINSVSFDHPDPSIFTVLTSESDTSGVAHLDFVIFPPRWVVAEDTFRPPYFHRNIMSELMGLIKGEYDAKQSGFLPGGVSIHNSMTAHGPDTRTFEGMSQKSPQKPVRYENTLAFMLETREPWRINEAAFMHSSRQTDYSACWQDLKKACLESI